MERLSKARVAAWRALDDAAERRTSGRIRLEGPHLVEEAARLGLVETILAVGPVAAGEWAMKAPEAEVLEVSDDDLARVVEQKTPAGVAAVARRPDRAAIEDLGRVRAPVLVLEAVQDPGNVGTLVRTAAAFGVRMVVTTPGTADPMGIRALRASAGALLRVPVAEATLDRVLEAARAASKLVWVPDVAAGDDYRAVKPASDFVLLASNEGAGTKVVPGAPGTRRVTIPMERNTESLNVGAAVAVILAHWRR